jgi:hypothetical protein
MPLNPRSAAKICWNYGCGAMLWTHLPYWPRLAGILRLRKRAGLAARRGVLLPETGSGGSTTGQIWRRATISGRFPRTGSALSDFAPSWGRPRTAIWAWSGRTAVSIAPQAANICSFPVNLWNNRLISPPRTPIAAKNCRNYGRDAIVRAHLSRGQLWPEF